MQTKVTDVSDASQPLKYPTLGDVGLEGVNVLVGLGLSRRQARVYLSLLGAGSAKAKAVARLARVPRQEAYVLLPQLQELGLVRQNLTAPITYSPTPVADGVRLLLEHKAEEFVAINEKAKLLIDNFQAKQANSLVTASNPSFGEVFGAEHGKTYQEAIESAGFSIFLVCSWVRFRQFSVHFESQLKDALKRGVALWLVFEKPNSHRLPEWIEPSLSERKFKFKVTPNPPDASVAIFDGEKASIAFDQNVPITSGVDLWTTHPALVAICQGYFHRVWGSIRG